MRGGRGIEKRTREDQKGGKGNRRGSRETERKLLKRGMTSLSKHSLGFISGLIANTFCGDLVTFYIQSTVV